MNQTVWVQFLPSKNQKTPVPSSLMLCHHDERPGLQVNRWQATCRPVYGTDILAFRDRSVQLEIAGWKILVASQVDGRNLPVVIQVNFKTCISKVVTKLELTPTHGLFPLSFVGPIYFYCAFAPAPSS